MNTIDILLLVHPVLMIAVVFPLVGIVSKLAMDTRSRRIDRAKLPPSVGKDHSTNGGILLIAVVLLGLLAEIVAITTSKSFLEDGIGWTRTTLISTAVVGCVFAVLHLGQERKGSSKWATAAMAWGLFVLVGMQPEVFRRSDSLIDPAFWQSHFWGATALVGLLCWSQAAQRDVLKNIKWRKAHMAVAAAMAALFIYQAATGSRDLLEIPLSWQKAIIEQCDFDAKTCETVVVSENSREFVP